MFRIALVVFCRRKSCLVYTCFILIINDEFIYKKNVEKKYCNTKLINLKRQCNQPKLDCKEADNQTSLKTNDKPEVNYKKR